MLGMKTWRGWSRPGRWRAFLRNRDNAEFSDEIRKQTFPPTADSAATDSSPSWRTSSTAACAPVRWGHRRSRERHGEQSGVRGREIRAVP